MRVTFTSFFRNGLADINAAAEELARRQREVSSQQRVHVPSDDPSAMTGIIGERSAMRMYDQYVEATDSVDSRLRVVDAVLSDLIRNLTAAQSTAAATQKSFATAQEREAYALELEGIRDAILTDVNTQFRGIFLFAGTASTTTPYVKDGSGVVQAYAGDHLGMAIDIDTNRSVDATIDGSTFVGDLFDRLSDLTAAVRAGDIAGIDTGVAAINLAFDRVTTAQSRVGNALSTLEDHKARLGEMRRASDARRSSLQDANLAEAITGMQQADTAHRAALGAVGTASRLSLLDYLR
jgi:flagellar hook-associated protein 3 FlgL